jgi:hypothetical protein
MRGTLFGLLFGCIVGTSLFAMPQSDKPRETIWLGSDLALGMSEEAAVAKLAELYSLRKMEPPAGLRAKGVTSMWIVDEKGEGTKHPSVGVVAFAAGKLSNVHKYLLPSDGDEVEFGRQVYFAMRDLELEGNSRCTIETENAEVPDFANKTAKLHCGRKTIIIDVQKFKGYAETVQLNEELDAR